MTLEIVLGAAPTKPDYNRGQYSKSISDVIDKVIVVKEMHRPKLGELE